MTYLLLRAALLTSQLACAATAVLGLQATSPLPSQLGVCKEYGPNSSLSGEPLFPNTYWTENIRGKAAHPQSEAIINAIDPTGRIAVRNDFGPKYHGKPNGMPYNVVGPGVRMVPFECYGDSSSYCDQSDRGVVPLPDTLLVENAGAPNTEDQDHHALIVQCDSSAQPQALYEVYKAIPAGDRLRGKLLVKWDLRRDSFGQRPGGWTSTDAAGLPVLPGVIRPDEIFCDSCEIQHAIRYTHTAVYAAYVPPASHYAGWLLEEAWPPFGARLRLRPDFPEAGYSMPVQKIIRALKNYGMILTDIGCGLCLSGAPDERYEAKQLRAELDTLQIRNFEVMPYPKRPSRERN